MILIVSDIKNRNTSRNMCPLGYRTELDWPPTGGKIAEGGAVEITSCTVIIRAGSKCWAFIASFLCLPSAPSCFYPYFLSPLPVRVSFLHFPLCSHYIYSFASFLYYYYYRFVDIATFLFYLCSKRDIVKLKRKKTKINTCSNTIAHDFFPSLLLSSILLPA